MISQDKAEDLQNSFVPHLENYRSRRDRHSSLLGDIWSRSWFPGLFSADESSTLKSLHFMPIWLFMENTLFSCISIWRFSFSSIFFILVYSSSCAILELNISIFISFTDIHSTQLGSEVIQNSKSMVLSKC